MTRIVIDAIGGDSPNLPAAAPTVAYYITGPGVAWTAAQLARFRGVKIPIDQAPGAAPHLEHPHLVLDIENGAKTIQDGVEEIRERAAHGLSSTPYVAASNLAALRAQIHAAGLHVDGYWVANWSLSQSEAAALLRGDIVAIQYASPTSNPATPVPGSTLTLEQANCDLSVAAASWFPAPAPAAKPKPKRTIPKPHPKVQGSTLGAAIGVGLTAVMKAAGVHIDAAEAGSISTLAALLAGAITPLPPTRANP